MHDMGGRAKEKRFSGIMVEEAQYKLVPARIGCRDYVWDWLHMYWSEPSDGIMPDCTPTETDPCTESFTLIILQKYQVYCKSVTHILYIHRHEGASEMDVVLR